MSSANMQLYSAIVQQDLAAAQKALAAGADPLYRHFDEDGPGGVFMEDDQPVPMLHLAVYCNNDSEDGSSDGDEPEAEGATPSKPYKKGDGSAIVKALIDAGASISEVFGESYPRNPLQIATAYGRLSSARVLLEIGMPPAVLNHMGDIGWFPVFHAARNNQTELLELVLAQPGIEVNLGAPARGTTPLGEACSYGNRQCIELLLAHPGTDVNATSQLPADYDEEQNTALHHVVAGDAPRLEIIQALLEAGADATKQDTKGRTPLDVLKERVQGREISEKSLVQNALEEAMKGKEG